jgi:hypothetical protein
VIFRFPRLQWSFRRKHFRLKIPVLQPFSDNLPVILKKPLRQINFIIGSQKAITSANINSKQDNLQVIEGKTFCAQHCRSACRTGTERQRLAEKRKRKTL